MAHEQTHTPGPWLLDEDDLSIIAQVGAHICAVTDVQDLPCIGEEHDEEKAQAECLANAHLITAAPDMLEIHEDSVEILEIVLEEREQANGEEGEILRDLIARIKAAIAKATGAAS